MAKYERSLTGDFDELLRILEQEIIGGSISASFEGGSDYQDGAFRCSVRVYERYSMIGSNRVSLNITLIGRGSSLFLSAIASGGSQAMFFKLNTFGEEAFLGKLVEIADRYRAAPR